MFFIHCRRCKSGKRLTLAETEQDDQPKIFEDKVIISKREYSTRGGGEANYLKSKRENRISKKAPEK